MHEPYESTSLTPLRVAQSSGYIDWASQPNLFKHYPDFLFHYPFGSQSALAGLELCRQITSERLIGSKPYYQLNVPSAGNLHPIELYVQIRGIKGILSGIYHIDAGASRFVLIKEIEKEGLEPYLGLQEQCKGMLLLVSCVPYRSEWKYGARALRYAYMDAGHQIGAIETALHTLGQETTILSSFQLQTLNEVMGFKEEEFVVAALFTGETVAKEMLPFKKRLMQVSPLTYNESSGTVEPYLSVSKPYIATPFPSLAEVKSEMILRRRSARTFTQTGIKKADFEHFMQYVNQPIESLSCYCIVLGASESVNGIYLKGKKLVAGEFSKKITQLLVDQSFILKSDIVIVMTAKVYSAQTQMRAAHFGHHIGMQAEMLDLGYSAIGAFYDTKLEKFLGTDEPILYVGVVGTK